MVGCERFIHEIRPLEGLIRVKLVSNCNDKTLGGSYLFGEW